MAAGGIKAGASSAPDAVDAQLRWCLTAPLAELVGDIRPPSKQKRAAILQWDLPEAHRTLLATMGLPPPVTLGDIVGTKTLGLQPRVKPSAAVNGVPAYRLSEDVSYYRYVAMVGTGAVYSLSTDPKLPYTDYWNSNLGAYVECSWRWYRYRLALLAADGWILDDRRLDAFLAYALTLDPDQPLDDGWTTFIQAVRPQ